MYAAGASWITQALLLCLGSITRSLPIITATFLGVIGCWLAAVRHLNTQLKVRQYGLQFYPSVP